MAAPFCNAQTFQGGEKAKNEMEDAHHYPNCVPLTHHLLSGKGSISFTNVKLAESMLKELQKRTAFRAQLLGTLAY